MAMFALICAIMPSISAFEPIGRALDEISVSDIYYSATRNRQAVDNDKFLIIDTSPCTRGDIAKAITHADYAGAAVIGIDIIFSLIDTDSLGTNILKQAVSQASNKTLVATHLNEWDCINEHYYSTIHTALDSVNVKKGYTNLINQSDNSYIRNYSVAMANEIPSFAQHIASEYLSIFGENRTFNPTTEGIIDFTPQNFIHINADDLQAIDSLSTGRIVLLGALNADEDNHYTPIGRMSGVLIQAYAINTLLERPTIITPIWLIWLIGLIFVLSASWGFVIIRNKFESKNRIASNFTYAVLGIGNLLYPTFTILMTIFIIGEIYVICNCYIPPLVIAGSLAFIPVAYDIYTLVLSLTGRLTTDTAKTNS